MFDVSSLADLTAIDRAHGALHGVLAAAAEFAAITVHQGAVLPTVMEGGDTRRWLNVLIAPTPVQVLGEVLGLGEDADGYEVEYIQTYHLEWLVQRDNDAARKAAFQAGLLAIDAALRADRTLGGAARGLTIGPPAREPNSLPFTAATLSALIPIRVQLRGRSVIS